MNNISTKDLSYVYDIFSWNLNAKLVCENFLLNINDDELKDIIENIKLMHEESCNDILEVIKNG